MRRFLLVAALAMMAMRCSHQHCSDQRPAVPLDVQQAAFTEMTMRGATHDFRVFSRGKGPAVVIFHELPGLSPATFRLAHRISEAGFTVYVPLLFGRPGDFQTVSNFVRSCGSGEFDCRSAKSHGRIATEMKALVAAIDAEAEGDGVNAIGMCLTGALPLELIPIDAPIRAAVVAQPAVPFFGPAVMPLPDGALDIIDKKNVPILATRFSEDGKSPRCRLELLEARLGDQVATIEIDSKAGNPYGFTKQSHAVLTSWYSDAEGHPTRNVLEQAIAMFRKD